MSNNTNNPMTNVTETMKLGPDSEVKKPVDTGRIFTIILFALIVFFLFTSLLFGMDVYRALDDSRTRNDDSRLGLSLIANSIRSNDLTDAVGAGNGPEGQSLVLTDRVDGVSFETRIYLYEGMLVEEYSIAETEYTPDRARQIVASETFAFSYDDGLLTVVTDQGETSIVLRSVRRGA